jgi:hypothetical protein
MEILRFEEATTTAPKRKKSSKGYLTIGFVAALFSVGSAFATTTSSININGRDPIALGQGITTFTTCDSKIAILPITKLNLTATDFVLEKVTIGAEYDDGINPTAYFINNDAVSATVDGCLDVDFVIKFYLGTSGTPVDACDHFSDVSDAAPEAGYKCFSNDESPSNSRIIFKVSKISHDIKFDGLIGTSFFDRISIETTSGTDYSPAE